MSNIKTLTSVLLELRTAAASIKTEEDLRTTMTKYDSMLFLGEKFNVIYANDLQRALKTVFDHEIPMPELLQLLPDVCKSLDMKVEPMTLVSDPDRKLADYQIELF